MILWKEDISGKKIRAGEEETTTKKSCRKLVINKVLWTGKGLGAKRCHSLILFLK